MAKKLPGTKTNPLFLGTLKHREEKETLSELELKKAHSKLKAAKHKAKNVMNAEEN